MKQTTIKNYKYTDLLGTHTSDTKVWVEPGYNKKSFIKKGDFSIDDKEIMRITDAIVHKFLKDNFIPIQRKKRVLSGDEISSIMTYMGLTSNDQFGDLIGHDKSKISRVKRDEEALSVQACISTVLLLWEEYKRSGYCRRLLGLDEAERREDLRLPWAEGLY
jgi:hypothetical protein